MTGHSGSQVVLQMEGQDFAVVVRCSWLLTIKVEQHFIGQKGLHDSSQIEGQVVGATVVAVAVCSKKFGQHLIGQFGSHFCLQIDGHWFVGVVGAKVVVVALEDRKSVV